MTTDQATLELARDWAALWDGDLSQTAKIIDESFVSHAAPLTGGPAGDTAGRDSLNAWVSGAHQVMEGLHFTIEIGPISDGDMVVVRWRADASYRGGFPGAAAAPGTPVRFYGTDVLRLVDGKIAEYWANADSLWFLQQIGLSVMPPLAR
jgi:predicted ester cyclase